jgi:hypothetical protein
MGKKLLLALAASIAVLVATGYAAVSVSIRSGVRETAAAAIARQPGDRIAALAAWVDCDSCPLPDRNRAVWALGQLRDRRALPVLEKHYTGAGCNHSAGLCQRELRKALDAVGSRHLVWLGYRE